MYETLWTRATMFDAIFGDDRNVERLVSDPDIEGEYFGLLSTIPNWHVLLFFKKNHNYRFLLSSKMGSGIH